MSTLEKSEAVTPRGIGGQDYSRAVQQYAVEPQLLLHEGFEDLPGSWTHNGSAGYSVERVTNRSWAGGACMRLRTGNAPAVANWAAYFQSFGVVRSLKLLMDVRFSLPLVNADRILFSIVRFTGSLRIRCIADYWVGQERWRYLDENQAWVNIPDGAQSLRQDPDTFHRMYLGVDFDTNEYMYLQCNEKMMYLTGISAPEEADIVTDPYTHVRLYAESVIGNLGIEHYFDNVRVAEMV